MNCQVPNILTDMYYLGGSGSSSTGRPTCNLEQISPKQSNLTHSLHAATFDSQPLSNA